MHDAKDGQVLSLSPEVRYRAVGDEGVVVHIDSGRVIVVNQVGLHIVMQLKNPLTHDQLIESVTTEFDVTPSQAAEDVDSFLSELDQERILVRQ